MYEFDDSRRPLLILRMHGPVTTAEIEQMKADVHEVIERAEPFSLVFDMLDVDIPPRAEVMQLLAWTRAERLRYAELYDEAVPRVPSFTAYHMPSMIGNLLRFFLEMLPSLRNQQMICSSYEDAVAMAEEAIERLGLDHRFT